MTDADRDDAIESLSPRDRTELHIARRAARWTGFVLPVLFTLVGTLVTAGWVPRMPNPMAIHWGPDLQPDGFGPPWSNVLLALGSGALLTALFRLRAWQGARPRGELWSPTHRFVPALIFGTVLGLEGLAVATAWVQLDAPDAADTGSIGGILLALLGVWIVAVVLAYRLQPRLRITLPKPDAAEPLPSVIAERAVWVGVSQAPRALGTVVLVVIGLLAAGALWGFSLLGETDGSDRATALATGWSCTGILVLTILLALSNTWFRVRIDRHGLIARGPFGMPVYRVAATDVREVRAVDVSPFAEFGGWGVRLVPGRFGIVLRTGPGIRIERRSRSRSFTITVDDAPSAAALLATVAEGGSR